GRPAVRHDSQVGQWTLVLADRVDAHRTGRQCERPSARSARGGASMNVFIGIDGGGSRTRAAVTDAGGEILARADGERGRIDPLDPTAGSKPLAELARRAIESAGERVPAESLCCALSGAGREAERALLEEALRAENVATTCIVVPD